MTPGHRARRAFAIAAVLVAVAIALPRFLTHTPYPRLGVTLDRIESGRSPKVQRVFAPPAEGVLHAEDELVALDGVSFGDAELMARLKAKGFPRGPIRLTIRRAGRPLEFIMPPVQLGAWQRLRLFIFPIAALIAAPLVAFLLVWRRPDLGAAWVFLWFVWLQGVGAIWGLFRYPQTEPAGGFALYIALYSAMVWWYPASFLHFMSVFPRPRWQGAGRWSSIWFWLVALAYLAPATMMIAWRGLPPEHVYTAFQAVVFPLGVVSLLDRYGRRGRPGWSPRLSERVLAIVVGLSLVLAAALEALAQTPSADALFPLPLVRVLVSAVTAAWFVSPLLIAFLIANDPVFDPRRVLVQSLPYALLSGILAALYLAVVLVSQRLFAQATGEEAMAVNVVAALLVAFAFAPLRERLQRGLDRLFGRDPRALRAALDRAGQQLLEALDCEQLRASVEAGLERGLMRPVALEWPAQGPPRLTPGEEVPADARGAVENLLLQAGARLENLALQEQRAADQRKAAELREAAAQAELRALHAQVQPHFLFNALNALSYLIETDAEAAQRFTERLADMLRYTVEAGSRPAALLSEEIGFVEDYLGVARERYENPLSFEYRGDPELLSLVVPPLLLQPLVENSLKHGCAPAVGALHLRLEAARADGWVTLEFADDGVSGGNGGPGLGLGLQNLEQRVRRFAGPEAVFEAGPCARGGFRVRMRWRAASQATA